MKEVNRVCHAESVAQNSLNTPKRIAYATPHPTTYEAPNPHIFPLTINTLEDYKEKYYENYLFFNK